MNLSRLKAFKCPECGQILSKGPRFVSCIGCKAGGFTRTLAEFDILMEGAYKKPKFTGIPTEEENMAELNNMGREQVAEDFSDSRALEGL